MNQTRLKSIASTIARKKLDTVFAEGANVTGTVQIDSNGGAWVHCMVFVPPVDIEEHVAAREREKDRA